MAIEKAIIVNDLAANKEWIKDDFNGLIIPSDLASDALEKAITMLLLNPEKRQLFGKRSRSIVEESASNDINMKKMEAYYNKLIKK